RTAPAATPTSRAHVRWCCPGHPVVAWRRLWSGVRRMRPAGARSAGVGVAAAVVVPAASGGVLVPCSRETGARVPAGRVPDIGARPGSFAVARARGVGGEADEFRNLCGEVGAIRA
ncbi:MAG: hypothetical protein ACRDTE_11590, partial [Pseudonocardiaceae bacterium]